MAQLDHLDPHREGVSWVRFLREKINQTDQVDAILPAPSPQCTQGHWLSHAAWKASQTPVMRGLG